MEKEGAPVTNIKDYIVNMRRSGQADSAIVAQLTSVGWPADIVMSACNEANAIFPANPEKPEPTLQQVVQAAQPGPALNSAAPQQVSASTPVASGPATSAAVQAPVQNPPPSSAIANSDLFTQPPSGIFSAADKPKEAGSNEKKKFSLFALLSLLFSPIPFIGLGMGMLALENISKKKMTGSIFAYLTILINLAIICIIIFFIYKVLTQSPDNMTGFARVVYDWLDSLLNLG